MDTKKIKVKKVKKKMPASKMLLILSFIAFETTIGIINVKSYNKEKYNEKYSNMQEEFTSDAVVDTAEKEIVSSNEVKIESTSSNEVVEEPKEVISTSLLDSGYEFINVGFDSLLDINSDICGWVVIDGTTVNYPIVSNYNDADNEDYNRADIYGNYDKRGTIRLDRRDLFNDEETDEVFTDVKILYGHNMHDGSMFADLNKYKNQSYLDEHPYSIIYLPGEDYVYRIDFFACNVLPGNDETPLYPNGFESEELFNEHIASLKEESTISKDIDLEYGDTLFKYVTCLQGDHNYRFVLTGKLTKEMRINKVNSNTKVLK